MENNNGNSPEFDTIVKCAPSLKAAIKEVSTDRLVQFIQTKGNISSSLAWNDSEDIVVWIKRVVTHNPVNYCVLVCFFSTHNGAGKFQEIQGTLAEKFLYYSTAGMCMIVTLSKGF
jgi:hypothetical protein